MEDSGNVLIIAKGERADVTGLRNETGKGKHRWGGNGNSGGDWLRTLRRGTNRDGHEDSSVGGGKRGSDLLGSRFRVKFQRQ